MTAKRLFKLFGSAVMALALLCAAMVAVLWARGDPGKDDQAVASGYARPDIAVVSDAHRAMLEIIRGADASSEVAGRQFALAGKRRDQVAMYQAATAMQASARAALVGLDAISRPSMSCGACASALVDAVGQVAQAYRHKEAAAALTMAAVDAGDIRPSQMAEIERLTVQSGAALLQGTGALFRAYQALGYPPGFVDVEHGGIVAAPPPVSSEGASR
jgi:hypothetical protein